MGRTVETFQTNSDVVVFHGDQCVAAGPLATVVPQIQDALKRGDDQPVFVLEAGTSKLVDFDFTGTSDEVLDRLHTIEAYAENRKSARPPSGVIIREVTLLRRHWDWLDEQPGGASVALRKLVEEARRTRKGADELRQAQDSVYRFMSTLAGDLEGFEEALRAFYALDEERFRKQINAWPADIREHALRLAGDTFRLARLQNQK